MRARGQKCYMGHLMTPENTYTYPSGIKSDCRKCARARWKIYYRRRKRKRAEGRAGKA